MTTVATPRRLYLMRVATIVAGGQTAPAPAYLIQLDDGTNILVDSGFAADIETGDEMRIEVERDVVAQLAALGLRPADIGTVVCTHLDPDHAGQHHLFTNAEFVVQGAHDAAARAGGERYAAARPIWDNPATRWRLIDSDTELVPGVELIESSGHVLGHQSVLVRLSHTGPVLLGIDALPFDLTGFTPEDRPLTPMDVDEAATRASTRKLLNLVEREGVRLIIYGHDEIQWRSLTLAPAYYE